MAPAPRFTITNKSGSCVGVLTPPQPEDVSSGLLILFVPRSKLTGYKKNKLLLRYGVPAGPNNRFEIWRRKKTIPAFLQPQTILFLARQAQPAPLAAEKPIPGKNQPGLQILAILDVFHVSIITVRG